ncbi:RUS1 family protein C16orf58 homolog [Coccomyxa sp. Obi]|nr:RUS1 family protein C16orf58 homolog [Coccomyxa sp. Obi]
MEKRVVGEEYDGERLVRSWVFENETEAVQSISNGSQDQSLLRWLRKGFLPDKYPDSVTPDYIDFQIWDSIQALCSYVRGMICSNAILTGIGVGKEAASPLVAVFQFFLRDLAGMCGGVLFAFAQGSELDAYAKQWRLFADIFNNFGYALDLLSPVFPDHFLLLACLGSLARAVTGVAGGATRAALTQHFSKAGNAADISAKEGSQETATTLVGMVVGMLFLRSAADSPVAVWAVFLLLTVLHIYANVRAVRSLQLTSLNRSRMDILLQHCSATKVNGNGRVLQPTEVAKIEPLLPPTVTEFLKWILCVHLWRPSKRLVIGARLSELPLERTLARMDSNADMKLIIALDKSGREASVVLRRDADSEDVLKAYVQGYLLLHSTAPMEQRHRQVDKWMAEEWPAFRGMLQRSGWALDRIALCSSSWRGAWGNALRHHHHHD